jgi:predicted PurR-regulated permease PerM
MARTVENLNHRRAPHAPLPGAWSVEITPSARWFCGALLVGLSLWVLHSFVQALLAACVMALASWPLYRRFRLHTRSRIGRAAAPAIFTVAMALFILAPLAFAFGALVAEANELLVQIAQADGKGLPLPAWLQGVPILGSLLAGAWTTQLSRPGTLLGWTQHTDPATLLAWAQWLGQFMARHLFIILFTILTLVFLYREGETLARGVRSVLRLRLGARADSYLALGTRAVRASVNGILVVGLFDGVFSGLAYAVSGAPHPAIWAAITGALALVPFLGYVAVVAIALRLAMAGAATAAAASFALGCVVLLLGDKVVRPAVARDGTRLGFVWVLMGCLGGFEVLGLVGLVVGPVTLSLMRELWEHQVRESSGHTGD